MNNPGILKPLLQPAMLALALLWTLPPFFLWLMNTLEGFLGLPPMHIRLIQNLLPEWLFLPSLLVVWALVCKVYSEEGKPEHV